MNNYSAYSTKSQYSEHYRNDISDCYFDGFYLQSQSDIESDRNTTYFVTNNLETYESSSDVTAQEIASRILPAESRIIPRNDPSTDSLIDQRKSEINNLLATQNITPKSISVIRVLNSSDLDPAAILHIIKYDRSSGNPKNEIHTYKNLFTGNQYSQVEIKTFMDRGLAFEEKPFYNSAFTII